MGTFFIPFHKIGGASAMQKINKLFFCIPLNLHYICTNKRVTGMANIVFETEGVDMPALDREVVEKWIVAVAKGFGKAVGTLTYIFCDDDEIIRVNREFLKHDYYTDIITFDYSTRRRISGDMYISLDTVRTNAALFGREYDDELRRVVIHGVLHLLGINDKGPGEREVMEQHENDALALLYSGKF